ncbi:MULTISPECIES: ferredoxin [Mycobacterium]|uniref:ferredoxin n=1 Tax=Mycobacterium TaxID=1763 RepID=UPI0021013579|nr:MULTISPECIES: ferredoxin [Mycobacterium]
MSRITIDSGKCQGHGRCVLIAPTHFDMDDDGFGKVLDDEAGSSPDVDEAVFSCPENAIRLSD